MAHRLGLRARRALQALRSRRAGRAHRALIALTAAALLAAACGGASGTTGSPSQSQGGQSGPATVRLVLAPDPVWEGMKSAGVVKRWEDQANIRIEASSPFDQFSAFAGGHADMVVVNALDVYDFADQAEREPVIIGKIATDRSFLAVRRTSQAMSLEDLIEAKIAVDSSLASTLLWGLIADALYGLDFRIDGPDFEVVVVDASAVADLVMNDDVDACICLPDFSVSYLAERRLRPLYDGRTAAEIYAEDVVGDPAAEPLELALVVDKRWHAQNPETVDAVLGMWDEGLRTWKANRHEYIREFQQLLSVQSDAEIDWLTEYVSQHDWVSDSAYITPDDSQGYSDIFARMKRIGLIANDAAEPEIFIYGQSLAPQE